MVSPSKTSAANVASRPRASGDDSSFSSWGKGSDSDLGDLERWNQRPNPPGKRRRGWPAGSAAVLGAIEVERSTASSPQSEVGSGSRISSQASSSSVKGFSDLCSRGVDLDLSL